MRTPIIAAVVLAAFFAGWRMNRAVADMPPMDPLTLYWRGLKPGDNIQLYLSGATVNTSSVEGRLTGFNGETFEMVQKVGNFQYACWVPRASVLFIEKRLSDNIEPATKP